jgi:hypothetical protein
MPIFIAFFPPENATGFALSILNKRRAMGLMHPIL